MPIARLYGLTLRSALPLPRTRRAARGPADIAVVHGRAAAFAALRRVLAPPLAGTWFEERALPDGRRYPRWDGLFEFFVAAERRGIVARRLTPASATPSPLEPY